MSKSITVDDKQETTLRDFLFVQLHNDLPFHEAFRLNGVYKQLAGKDHESMKRRTQPTQDFQNLV